MNQRNNKQRNYYRNGDIVYNENRTKLGGALTNYEVIEVSDPNFSLNENNGNLYYINSDTDISETLNKGVLSITIDPFIYIKVEANDEMYLIGEVPNILSTSFELDETNGNFIINI